MDYEKVDINSFATESGRIIVTDMKITKDVISADLGNKSFVRVIAKDITFDNISFMYCHFIDCYFRRCTFTNCNFTGCKFVDTNCYGSTFSGCTFDYSAFNNTIIDSHILDTNCPAYDNLKLKFAKELRTNYMQIGDADSVNKAIIVELGATSSHLKKSWKSNESYYRKKYRGAERLYQLGRWLRFRIMDYTWGNGESTIKLIRAVVIVLIFMTFIDVLLRGEPLSLSSLLDSVVVMPGVFVGSQSQADYPSLYSAMIALFRYVLLGFFLSIVIKRFNRR